jgi:hypothetical protein
MARAFVVQSSALKLLVFLALLFVLFLANMSVYGNAVSGKRTSGCTRGMWFKRTRVFVGPGGTSLCVDLSGYVCLVGVFAISCVVAGGAVVVQWWRSTEPFHFSSSAFLRWTAGVMGLFWLITFIVGFAAAYWVNKQE